MAEKPDNAESLDKAVQIAIKYHKGQFRRLRPLPYVTHVFLVAHRLARWGITDKIPYVIECGILHDVMEDAFEEFAAGSEIMYGMGERYYGICQELTFKCNSEDPRSKNDQKNAYLESFESKSVEAVVIKVADRLWNSEDFEPSGQLDEAEFAYHQKRQRGYLKSGGPVFRTVLKRRDEIQAAFGILFYENMVADIFRVHNTLGVDTRHILHVAQ